MHENSNDHGFLGLYAIKLTLTVFKSCGKMYQPVLQNNCTLKVNMLSRLMEM